MGTKIKCFWIEPTGQERVWLRRFKPSKDGSSCPLPWGYHDQMVLIGDRPRGSGSEFDTPSDEDVRWPSHCACGYEFQDEDTRQVFVNPTYAGAPDGNTYALREVPAGAMWDAEWYREGGFGECWTGPDGLCLIVKTPGGDWMVDSQASNCTRDQYGPKVLDGVLRDKVWLGRTHYCWVRHGDPRTGNIHVDKAGNTCNAGAGSIIAGSYHGYLHNGYLEEC